MRAERRTSRTSQRAVSRLLPWGRLTLTLVMCVIFTAVGLEKVPAQGICTADINPKTGSVSIEYNDFSDHTLDVTVLCQRYGEDLGVVRSDDWIDVMDVRRKQSDLHLEIWTITYRLRQNDGSNARRGYLKYSMGQYYGVLDITQQIKPTVTPPGGAVPPTSPTPTPTPTSCRPISVSLDPASLSFAKDGGSRSVTVTALASTCQWSISGAPEWIQFAKLSGQGTQVFSCNVLANNGTSSRSATVVIAGASFNFSQEAPSPSVGGGSSIGNTPPCASVSTRSLSFSSMGGSKTIDVSTNQSTCSWDVTNSSYTPWLTVNSRHGMGNQTVTITTAANNDQRSRHVTLNIGGQLVEVTQAAPPLPNAYDIVVVQKTGTMSGRAELSALSALATYNNYSAKALATGFHYTGDEWTFQMADWDHDGHLDLIGVHKNGTPSGKTEVHILSGASGFTQYSLHTRTALSLTNANHAFAMADWDRDGHLDLFMIQKAGTGSGTTEVHILSGKSNFSQFILHTRTALQQSDGNWEFIVADWNRDGRPDLIGIAKKATGSGMTEVHILVGASSFDQFILHTRTALGEVGREYQFVMIGKIKEP